LAPSKRVIHRPAKPLRAGNCYNQRFNRRCGLQRSLARSTIIASLQKILITRSVNSQGDRVRPSTPGAIRISEKGAKYYAC